MDSKYGIYGLGVPNSDDSKILSSFGVSCSHVHFSDAAMHWLLSSWYNDGLFNSSDACSMMDSILGSVSSPTWNSDNNCLYSGYGLMRLGRCDWV